jgi:CRISPR-associated exonuclease Cas4
MTILNPPAVNIDIPFRVTDLKQWVYCPRILYYQLCLPDVRPTTYKMEAGIEAGRDEEGRETRRSLKAYHIEKGRREFDVSLCSPHYGLRGVADMVIWVDLPAPGEVIPVDYKLSDIPGEHFKLQITAYGMMLEESSGIPAKHGFLYSIPQRKAIEVKFTSALRKKLIGILEAMGHMLYTEHMPQATPNRNKCLACEFRRFCNDVI